MADTFSSAAALLAHKSPVDPVVGLRPHLIQARARRVLAAFPGDVLYAVKCNDAPEVLRALWAGGVREFDTASIGEVRAVKALLPRARCHFMHPVKSVGAIAEAYHDHGVRRFVFDHPDELAKIVAATGCAERSRAVRAAGRAGRGFAAGADRQVRRRRRGCRGAGARGAWLRPAGGPHLPCRLAVRRSRWPMAGRSRSRPRWCARSARSTISMSAAASRRATWATSPSSRRSWRSIREAVARHGLGLPPAVRARPRAGRRRRLGAGAGRAAPRRQPLPERRRLREPGRAEVDRAAVPDAAGSPGRAQPTAAAPASTCSAPPATASTACPGPHWLPADTDEGDWVEVGMMGAYSQRAEDRLQRLRQREAGDPQRRRLVSGRARAAGPACAVGGLITPARRAARPPRSGPA